MKNFLIGSSGAAMALFVAFGASGCAHRPFRRESTNPPAAVQRNASLAGVAGGAAASAEEPSVRESRMHPIDELKAVRFDYDSSHLRPEDRAVLVGNADWLKSHPAVRVQVAGHCDQRGTVEYNLALGQRRAASVRDYYLKLGVPGHRVATISYGKEKPLCGEAAESCWRQNRRAETLGALPKAVNVSSQ